MKFALVLCLLLASCARPGAKPQIRIAVPSGSVAHLHIYMAKHLGYFEREGLDVHLEELSSTGKTMEALLGGSVDVSGISYEQVLLAATAGREAQSFFVLITRPSQVLVVAPGRPHIRRVPDLRGRTVGVTSLGSATQNVLSLILIKHGMSLADVTPVAVGNSATAIAALENGKVDAAVMVSLPFEVLRNRRPDTTVLFDTRTPEGTAELFGIPNLPATAVAASARWLADNGESARRIAQALANAGRWLREHSIEEIEASMPESLRPPNADAGRNALRVSLPSLSLDGRMPPNGPAAIRDFLKLAVDPSLNIDLRKTYTDEFLERKP